MKIIISILLLFLTFPVLSIELKIVTPKGYVAFVVEDQWPVLNMQTKLPVTASVFQIPNNADVGSGDSTNLVINVYDPKSAQAKQALTKVGKQLGAKAPVVEVFNDWTMYWQEPVQGNTTYTLVDAKRSFENYIVSVRLAWPHLPGNPAGYDKQMYQTLRTVLGHIRVFTGAVTPNKDEVIRRPSP
jgi:hypothetical protein